MFFNECFLWLRMPLEMVTVDLNASLHDGFMMSIVLIIENHDCWCNEAINMPGIILACIDALIGSL